MRNKKRKKIAAGNWKMNLDLEGAQQLATAIAAGAAESPEGISAEIVLGVPYPFLAAVSAIVSGHPRIRLSAQNMHKESSGAFTGEVSGTMLKSVGCSYVILGHSERRQHFGESSAQLAHKVSAALACGLTPIYCVGETLAERESGKAFEVVKAQITEGLNGIDPKGMYHTVIAYEPVWAIGTGKTASPEQAQEVHAYIRLQLKHMFGDEIASIVPILYGGSVNAQNAALLFACGDIDGGLVGGASLKAEDFLRIAASFYV